MLDFALNYRRVIDAITGEQARGLRTFELTPAEWELMESLRNILRVRLFLS